MTIAELTTQSSTPVTTQATGTAPTTAASSAFAQTMQSAVQALTSSDLLLQRPVSGLEKPGMKDFMDATGVDAETAAELLTGIMGSNQDYRNWKTIMASSDPLQAARQATAAQYSSDLPYATADNKTIPDQKSIVAKTSNLEVIDYGELAPPAVYLTDKQGMLLRWLQPDSESIMAGLTNFGFDTSQINDLAVQLKALKNVEIEQQVALT
ncbi:MAG: hypothetical protein PHC49_19815 [Desulfuromonadaceae bacterium]|nr:hypothetical protein [Desulfuromonadaceae bacterium]